jgi:hypothetical protein
MAMPCVSHSVRAELNLWQKKTSSPMIAPCSESSGLPRLRVTLTGATGGFQMDGCVYCTPDFVTASESAVVTKINNLAAGAG